MIRTIGSRRFTDSSFDLRRDLNVLVTACYRYIYVVILRNAAPVTLELPVLHEAPIFPTLRS